MKRSALLRLVGILLVGGAPLSAAAQMPSPSSAPVPAPVAPPTPTPTLTSLVSDLIVAGSNAATDLYTAHQFGPILGFSKQEVLAFDLRYTRLSGSANGLLESIAFQLDTNSVDAPKVAGLAGKVLAEARDFDVDVNTIQRRQASTGTRNIGSFLKALLPLVSPVLQALSSITEYTAGVKKMKAQERHDLAVKIRREKWLDAKTAATNPTMGATPDQSPSAPAPTSSP